jgi:hypothetical protein
VPEQIRGTNQIESCAFRGYWWYSGVKLGEEIKLSFCICGTSIATHFGPLHAGKARDQRRGAGHHFGGVSPGDDNYLIES